MEDKIQTSAVMSRNFVVDIVQRDLAVSKNGGKVATRFPPEPNGYLHLGHAKSICLNFGIAQQFGGTCNLRFDDTNPAKEEEHYMTSIKEMIHWLGFAWEERLYYASNYFEKFYEFALRLIEMGKAYVCDLTPEEIREYRGTLTTPGKDSPYRDRSITENLELFQRMRAGEFADGSKVLRAKIDMKSPNLNLRDPVIYRVRHVDHPKTGSAWSIYPMYDFAHCISDALEGITHSICTLEFEDHRVLYDWFLDQFPELPHPQQIEFARLNLTYTVMSKRKLLELVDNHLVNGWDDPRLPTLAAIRRRGVTPRAIRNFCKKIGVTKQDGVIEMSFFEECVREDLNLVAPRVMAVLNPLKVVLTNFSTGEIEQLDAPYHPSDSNFGSRKLPFTREIYIEKSDFSENPPQGFFRLQPGKEVRLRYGYIIKCTDVIKDATGAIVEIHGVYDPKSRGGNPADGRKVKGTIHWVSATEHQTVEVRLYDRLFTVPNPGGDREVDFKDYLNPSSLEILHEVLLEKAVVAPSAYAHFQFERQGYFSVDPDSTEDHLVFNRTVALRDTWNR